MKYHIKFSRAFKKSYKKLAQKEQDLLLELIRRLANGEVLEAKYEDHALTGEWIKHRECHVKPNLLLIYQKFETILVLKCVAVGSHSELFE